jgi:hypothetical protein
MKSYIVAFDRKARVMAARSNEVDYVAAELKKTMPVRTRGEGLIKANVQGKYVQVKNE